MEATTEQDENGSEEHGHEVVITVNEKPVPISGPRVTGLQIKEAAIAAGVLDETSITPYPQPVGTPSFMAPEVIRGGRAKKESDLWSLGVILYVLLSRRHPFYGRYADRFDDHEALAAIARGPSPL